LLNNTNQYHYAHAFGLAEYFISSFFVPHKYDEGFWNLPYLAAGEQSLLALKRF
jgi:protein-S-isoprenylcysteine O-methyltransferase